MSAECQPAESRSAATTFLTRSLLAYGLLLVAVEVISRVHYRASLPQLHYLSPERARALVEGHFADDLVFRVAFLSLPLLTAALLVRWNGADPLGELGLRGRLLLRQLLLGLVLGVAAYHLAWLALAWLSGTSDAWRGFDLWLTEEVGYWQGKPGLALMALGLCYAMGRTLIPFGHLYARLESAWGSTVAVTVTAWVFALPHLASAYVSLLCLLNLLLAGYAMGLVRARGGTLGVPLGALAGWTAVERMADLALGDSSLAQAYAQSLPTLISGGFSGVSGSLVVTLLLSAWLVWLLRPARGGAQPPEPNAAALAEVEGEGEVRPEGFEPPAP